MLEFILGALFGIGLLIFIVMLAEALVESFIPGPKEVDYCNKCGNLKWKK